MANTDLSPINAAKKAAADTAASLIQNGMLVGLGTGSTAYFFIEALGKKCHEGLKITAAATSDRSTQQAKALGIPLIENSSIIMLDVTVDGADEIDLQKNMIKGGGGALLKEKILAKSSKEMIVIVDETKLVKHLGAFPLPVEISPFAYPATLLRLNHLGYRGKLRLNPDQSIYLTDNSNYIFDIHFDSPILNPGAENDLLKSIVGVIDTGLFLNMAGRVIIGYEDGRIKIET